MYYVRTVLEFIVLFCITQCCGCENGRWTEYFYVNLSKVEVRVTIAGITPNASVGVLLPEDGTEQLKEVVANYTEPINVDEMVVIIWTSDGESGENIAELKRDDLDIPARIRGGRLTFTFTEDEKWEITYSR